MREIRKVETNESPPKVVKNLLKPFIDKYKPKKGFTFHKSVSDAKKFTQRFYCFLNYQSQFSNLFQKAFYPSLVMFRPFCPYI